METSTRFDRQQRIFGAEGQVQISKACIALIGVGGLGSHLAQQLSYLGVNNFHLVDADTVGLSNLNRTIGATLEDVGRLKTEVASRLVQSINKDAHVCCHPESVNLAFLDNHLKDVDFFFGCVDNDAARLSILQHSATYAIPYLDVATGIEDDGKVLGGRVYLSGSDGCLMCADLLDQAEIRDWTATEAEKKFRDQVYGVPRFTLGDSGPSVVSLNGLLASIAANEFMMAITNHTPPVKYLEILRRSAYGNWSINSQSNPSPGTCYFCDSYSRKTRQANPQAA